VREAIFNILGDVRGRRVLDVYCGAGTLGIEALSRGAASAVFVDGSVSSLKCAKENLRKLGLSAPAVKRQLPRGLERVRGEFDLIFSDPPYADEVVSELGTRLRVLATEGATWIHEHSSRTPVEAPAAWTIIDTRRYGDTALTLLRPADRTQGESPQSLESP